MRARLTFCWCLLAVDVSSAADSPAGAPLRSGAHNRIALVVGNAGYAVGALNNPVGDARAMAATLQELGFDVVVRENAGLQAMIGAMREFSLRARNSDVRLFYYAGHGAQIRGKNYLIPVDAELGSDDDIAAKSADVSELIEGFGLAQQGLSIVILDACRTNPFIERMQIGPDGKPARYRGGSGAGLAQVAAPTGVLVEFATAPGAVAMDGGDRRHSLYTRHLLAHIAEPGLPVEQVFKRVRNAVAQETNGLQVPWESSSLRGDFCFRPAANGRCTDSVPGDAGQLSGRVER